MSCEVFGRIVSRETYDKLRDYESLIQKWNPSINLVAKSTLSDIWTRHIVLGDPLQPALRRGARHRLEVVLRL